jgi:pSer/pThr/pTyr-binding forkhead associated (FHA) protein
MGKEFRLAAQMIKVGRDPQFCDFALFDDFVSNPHFSIQLEQTQLFITDEGSTNGTQVNSMPLPPHQRILLQPDAIIELGQTRLQFKRLGGTTQPLEQGDDQAFQPLDVEQGGPTQQVTR